MAQEALESSARRKTSKYFDKDKPKDVKQKDETPVKRSRNNVDPESITPPPLKKLHKLDDEVDLPKSKTPTKKLKTGSGRGSAQKPVSIDENDQDEVKDPAIMSAGRGRGRGSAQKKPVNIDEDDEDEVKDSAIKSAGRGRGRGSAQKKPVNIDEDDEDEVKDSAIKSAGRGRGGMGAPAAGRGRGGGGGGGGRGGFMNFGERKDPPHKGEKDVPEGAPDCLAGLTFVISGTLDSLEREEAEDLIKRHGGRVTGSVSKKTTYLLCDEDIGGRKSEKARELGTTFLTEDGLFDKIRSSNKSKRVVKAEPAKAVEKIAAPVPKKTPLKESVKTTKSSSTHSSPAKSKEPARNIPSLPWTEKYRPKVPTEIVGNQSLVTQIHNWLKSWNDQFLHTGKKEKGKKQTDSGAKKAVLLCGVPGIGKTTSAQLVCKMLGFQAVEVNASDSRGKADNKIAKGIGGSNPNAVKELVNNEALSVNMDWSKNPKTALIMDEVDGMSAGDRGGVADLIASIKMSKIPIICICNDRYSQKLKSLINYCLVLTYRKPTKQQMGKRLMQIAKLEGLQVNEIALEELAERSNGDMRMAVNQLQYMSLSMSAIKYDDIRQRLLSSAKDEDISPFTAVDKLFGFNGGKLRMDERIDLSMSDPDLVPLIIQGPNDQSIVVLGAILCIAQENYLNYKPSSMGKDDNGLKCMNAIARAAESIGDGDIINVQIRRYRQWQLSQTGSLTSSIIPAALMHGSRVTLEQGERNFNRFGGWLGKNSTAGKNVRLLEDLHVHMLASRESNLGRVSLRLEYLTLLLKQLTDPLHQLPKDEAVNKVVNFMNEYSITQEDFDTIMDISKFKGQKPPLEGIAPDVKGALTRAYNKENKSRAVKAADLVNFPGMKKAPKKRIAAMLEPSDDLLGEEKDEPVDNGEESETEDLEDTVDGEKLQTELQSLNSKGIQVQLELKGAGNSNGKKAAAGRGRGGGGASASKEKKTGGRGSGAAGAKRKR
ncbi:hypothetical protein ACFE04_015567 [Oxalis oulophora]